MASLSHGKIVTGNTRLPSERLNQFLIQHVQDCLAVDASGAECFSGVRELLQRSAPTDLDPSWPSSTSRTRAANSAATSPSLRIELSDFALPIVKYSGNIAG